MSKPKISIVVPVFNVEAYLPECLDSLVQQELEDIEMIFIDDGSTDRSAFIIKEYQRKDPRISLFSQENRGNGTARNTGVQRAVGEYIFFVDSDDWISSHTCQTIYEKAAAGKLDVLVFSYYLVFAHRTIVREQFVYPGIMDGKDYIIKSLKANLFSTPPVNKLIKTELAKQLDFEVDCIYEDLEYSFALMLKAKRVSSIADPLYFYRRFRKGAITQRLTFRHLADLLQVYALIEKKLAEAGLASIRWSAWFGIHKYEKISMEILYKLIDDTDRDQQAVNSIVTLLKQDRDFRQLSDFYLKKGSSIKHKLVLVAFRMSPGAYISIGRMSYPLFKKLHLAV